MKKILMAGVFTFGALTLFSCERTNRTTDADTTLEDNKSVVDRDTVVTEYEVTETVVQYDTTTRTRTESVDEKNRRSNHDRKNNNSKTNRKN